MDIDITHLPKHRVLKALFDASRQQGMGFLDASGAKPLDLDDAREITSQTLRFDYLRGRVLKVDISGDFFCPDMFDSDNGHGAAAHAIAALREEMPAQVPPRKPALHS